MVVSKTIESVEGANSEPYIGKSETARRLDIGLRTLDRWMSRGWVPYYKMGSVVLFKWSEVDAYVSKTCRKATLSSNRPV